MKKSLLKLARRQAVDLGLAIPLAAQIAGDDLLLWYGFDLATTIPLHGGGVMTARAVLTQYKLI